MPMYENNTNGEDSMRQIILDYTQAGNFSKYELDSGPYFKDIQVVTTTRISRCSFPPHNLEEIFLGSETSEFKDLELITDFSGEPYTALRGIPITVRSIDAGEGFEVSWDEANIAMVGDSRIEAIHALKENILYTMEALEENANHLAPEPKRQLNVLRAYLKHTP